MKILKALALKWDLLTERYQAFIAINKEDVQGCIQVLEEVRRKELNRVSGNSVLQSSAFAEQETDYLLVACRDSKTGKIVGCMRLTKAKDVANISSSREEYQLDLFEKSMIDDMSIFTRLAVIPSYRKTPAALAIMSTAFLYVLEEGGQAVLMSCEPNLFKLYMRLGLRPIGPIHNSSSGGYRIPMICLPDVDYFQQIRSPALNFLAGKVDWEKYAPIRKWYHDHVGEAGELQLGASLFEFDDWEKAEHWAITDGLSEDSLKKFLKNAISVKCQEGDLLIAKADGGKFVGIIHKGFGRVVVANKTIAILSEGDVFGEMAYILDQYRSANVVAGDSSTEIILFNVKHLQHIATFEERMIIWRNMAKMLARRLLDSHKYIHDIE